MSELHELKRHIRWLEDRAKWDDGLGETVDEIDARLCRIEEVFNNHADTLRRVCDAFNKQAGNLERVADGLMKIIEAINKAAAPQPPLTSPFGEVFAEF